MHRRGQEACSLSAGSGDGVAAAAVDSAWGSTLPAHHHGTHQQPGGLIRRVAQEGAGGILRGGQCSHPKHQFVTRQLTKERRDAAMFRRKDGQWC